MNMKELYYGAFLSAWHSPQWRPVVKKSIRKLGGRYNDVTDLWHLAEACDQDPDKFLELKPLLHGNLSHCSN